MDFKQKFKSIFRAIIAYAFAGVLGAMGLAPEQTIGKLLKSIFQNPPAYLTQNTARWIFVITAVLIIITVHLKWLLGKFRHKLSKTQEQMILFLGGASSDFSAIYQDVLSKCNIEDKSREEMHGERVRLVRFGLAEYSNEILRLTDKGFERYERLIKQGKEFSPISDAQPIVVEPEDSGLKINVTPMKDGDDLLLKVQNQGEAGLFRAQVEFVRDSSPISGKGIYLAKWGGSGKPESKILKGQSDRIKLAHLHIKTGPIPMLNYGFSFFINGETKEFKSTSWIPGKPQTLEPEIFLQVTISSEPSMIDGPFVGEYKLEIDGPMEISNG